MELAQMEVDDEWEILSDDGFLEISDDHAGNQIYSRNSNSSSAAVFHTNYFICPSTPPFSPKFVETTAANRLLPDSHCDRDQPAFQNVNIESFSAGGGAEQDQISQVFFKKMKEAEFVDMKVDSPKSTNKYEPNIGGDPCKFDAEMAIENEKDGDNVWKRGLSGIGAICSFGVAAATFCIIVFTNHHNHKLHFRIYTDEKRMKVKGATAATSGVHINRARITVGGYYDAAAV